jgi:hypothetical protein
MILIVNLDKTKLAYCAEVNSRSREKFAKVNLFVRSRAVHHSQSLLQSLPHSSQNIPPTTNNQQLIMAELHTSDEDFQKTFAYLQDTLDNGDWEFLKLKSTLSRNLV